MNSTLRPVRPVETGLTTDFKINISVYPYTGLSGLSGLTVEFIQEFSETTVSLVLVSLVSGA
jgi:hypothetical protein